MRFFVSSLSLCVFDVLVQSIRTHPALTDVDLYHDEINSVMNARYVASVCTFSTTHNWLNTLF